jgi:1,4-alpha-glucan branching enzyme
MISQQHITPDTPMGGALLPDGATFRAWAPRARQVFVNGTFGGVPRQGQVPELLLAQDDRGYWTGFLPGAKEGDLYKFRVVGEGSSGFKRDPYARELAPDQPFPNSSCILRPGSSYPGSSYPWHDGAFRTPDFSDMIVYQLHIGTYPLTKAGPYATFLDFIDKIAYLAALGVNVLQPLPIDEVETTFSLGYNGSDYFSPDMPYVVRDPAGLNEHLARINKLLADKGRSELTPADIQSGPNQLKALIDLCHVYGIAVVLDVVYNHAGGFDGDDAALYFWDRAHNSDNNNSLYFTDKGWAGGLAFALWNKDVRQFLINNATYYLREFHVDGFRYDEVSVLVNLNGQSGWSFCQDLTRTVRFLAPRAIQNAEFWPVNADIVRRPMAGAGFDVTQHDSLRDGIREAIRQSSFGAASSVDLDAVARSIRAPGFDNAWQAVTCIENHDIVKAGTGPRVPRHADGANSRSWYARSRSRFAAALLFTAPGIPMIFMGQEFLEDKQWSDNPNGPNLLYWDGLATGDKSMIDFLRFMQDLIQLRWRHVALRGEPVNVFHVSNPNRVIAFHRWIEGEGRDVVVVGSLREETWYGYTLGFPTAGQWREVFNSDVYDNWVNPMVAGNGGAIEARPNPIHGFAASADIVIPANGVVVFALGDA